MKRENDPSSIYYSERYVKHVINHTVFFKKKVRYLFGVSLFDGRTSRFKFSDKLHPLQTFPQSLSLRSQNNGSIRRQRLQFLFLKTENDMFLLANSMIRCQKSLNKTHLQQRRGNIIKLSFAKWKQRSIENGQEVS